MVPRDRGEANAVRILFSLDCGKRKFKVYVNVISCVFYGIIVLALPIAFGTPDLETKTSINLISIVQSLFHLKYLLKLIYYKKKKDFAITTKYYNKTSF